MTYNVRPLVGTVKVAANVIIALTALACVVALERKRDVTDITLFGGSPLIR
jgi:hypothetical protein